MKTKYVEKIVFLCDFDYNHLHGTTFEVFTQGLDLKVKLKKDNKYIQVYADFDSNSDISVECDNGITPQISREIETILRDKFPEKVLDYLRHKLVSDCLKGIIICK